MKHDRFDDYIRSLKADEPQLRELTQSQSNIVYIDKENIQYHKPTGTDIASEEYDLAVINCSLVIPDKGIVEANVYIKDGKIRFIGNDRSCSFTKSIDAQGRYVIPGLVDPHVHLGIYDSIEKEMESETRAAIHGGITTIGVFLGGQDSHFRTYPNIVEVAEKKSYVDIIPHFVISTEEQASEIHDYNKHFGVTSYKIYMNGIPGMIPDVNDEFIIDVYNKIRKLDKDAVLCVHAENNHIVKWASNKIREEKGETATIFDWTDTHPAVAEAEAIQRIAEYARLFQIKTYIVHISSSEGIETLSRLKESNPYIYGETTSPYLSLSRDLNDKKILMEPPVRDSVDIENLWSAARRGVLDTIATDNVSLTLYEKRLNNSIWEVLPGYSVLETHLATVLSEGYHKRNLQLEKLVSLVTKNPARIFGVYPKKGTIATESDADLVILDIDKEARVNSNEMKSRSDFSPYEGKTLKGWAKTVIKNGVVVVEDGKATEALPMGNVLK